MADGNSNWAKDLAQQIKWASQNSGGSGMAGMAAMLGVPFQQKRGGQWMTIDPRSQSIYVSGTTPYGGGGSPPYGGGGSPQMEEPPLPPYDPNGDGSGKMEWKFPQYSQTWAFTPPEPTPYPYPQPFDPKKYGDPFAKKFK